MVRTVIYYVQKHPQIFLLTRLLAKQYNYLVKKVSYLKYVITLIGGVKL